MTRVVYSDLDGTMVGPGGSFFLTRERDLTLEPAQALVELHAAGIALVLVSGRTRPQLVEACRIFGADGFVGELGAVLGWSHGWEGEVLRGAMPEAYAGRTPMQVLRSLGVVDRLFAAWPGMLEWHSPWHAEHDADAMLRGLVDVSTVEDWLAEQALGWLRIRDNGVLPRVPPHSTLRPQALPAHVYHLMPDGLSKGLGVARDMTRRGLAPADAVAIGDSLSDLDMATYVRELWLVANGAGDPATAAAARVHGNVRIAAEAVGRGWARAVRSVVGTVRAGETA